MRFMRGQHLLEEAQRLRVPQAYGMNPILHALCLRSSQVDRDAIRCSLPGRRHSSRSATAPTATQHLTRLHCLCDVSTTSEALLWALVPMTKCGDRPAGESHLLNRVGKMRCMHCHYCARILVGDVMTDLLPLGIFTFRNNEVTDFKVLLRGLCRVFADPVGRRDDRLAAGGQLHLLRRDRVWQRAPQPLAGTTSACWNPLG